MKRSKRIFILLGILVLCCIAAFAVTAIEEQKEAIRTSEDVIMALEEAQVQSLSWELNETSLAFHRDENGVWKWDEDSAFPVEETAIAKLLSVFESFSVAFTIESPEDVSQYGLDDPVCTVNLATAETDYTLLLGNFSKLDSRRYVSIGDGNVYLVSTDPMDTYDVSLSDLICHDTLPVFGTVDSITFAGEESYTLTYQEDTTASYCAEDVYFTGGKALDTDQVETYLHGLSYMDLIDYVTYNAAEDELVSYGLADPTLTVTVNYTVTGEDESQTAETFTLHIGLVTEEAESEEDTPLTTAYARVGDSQLIYELAADDEASVLAYTYNDLRHSDIFTADMDTVTGMDISLEGNTHSFVTATNEDDKTVWLYGETEISVSSVQSRLKALQADSFTEESPDGQEEIRVTLYLTNDYAEIMEIVLYRVDGSLCLCEVNGESIALVSRSDVVNLIEAVNAIVLNG